MCIRNYAVKRMGSILNSPAVFAAVVPIYCHNVAAEKDL
jgi:hypothetical protein